jgi:hypothetical protein
VTHGGPNGAVVVSTLEHAFGWECSLLLALLHQLSMLLFPQVNHTMVGLRTAFAMVVTQVIIQFRGILAKSNGNARFEMTRHAMKNGSHHKFWFDGIVLGWAVNMSLFQRFPFTVFHGMPFVILIRWEEALHFALWILSALFGSRFPVLAFAGIFHCLKLCIHCISAPVGPLGTEIVDFFLHGKTQRCVIVERERFGERRHLQQQKKESGNLVDHFPCLNFKFFVAISLFLSLLLTIILLLGFNYLSFNCFESLFRVEPCLLDGMADQASRSVAMMSRNDESQ